MNLSVSLTILLAIRTLFFLIKIWGFVPNIIITYYAMFDWNSRKVPLNRVVVNLKGNRVVVNLAERGGEGKGLRGDEEV